MRTEKRRGRRKRETAMVTTTRMGTRHRRRSPPIPTLTLISARLLENAPRLDGGERLNNRNRIVLSGTILWIEAVFLDFCLSYTIVVNHLAMLPYASSSCFSRSVTYHRAMSYRDTCTVACLPSLTNWTRTPVLKCRAGYILHPSYCMTISFLEYLTHLCGPCWDGGRWQLSSVIVYIHDN